MLKDRAQKTKNLMEGLGVKSDVDSNTSNDINVNSDIDVSNDDKIDKDSSNAVSDYSKLISGKPSEEMVMKGLYLRKDQVETLERYSKISNKSYSEFVRDALDIVFAEIEKAQQ